nr:hypothetical protein [Arthrobacter sp.]
MNTPVVQHSGPRAALPELKTTIKPKTGRDRPGRFIGQHARAAINQFIRRRQDGCLVPIKPGRFERHFHDFLPEKKVKKNMPIFRASTGKGRGGKKILTPVLLDGGPDRRESSA